jgi:hypothetical protein
MIYDFPTPTEPIRQGDIFQSIPRMDFDLADLPVIGDETTQSGDWLGVVSSVDPITALVAMRPVLAIVITQDCDTVRVDDIALCEIDRFDVVEASARGARYPNKTMSVITKHSKLNLKWFYLPPDDTLGFSDKMGVDFHSVLRVSRTYLENNLSTLRKGRLNPIATQHFRERLSEYYRRYPYDEWYPLDRAEFAEYQKSKQESVEPYPWQR